MLLFTTEYALPLYFGKLLLLMLFIAVPLYARIALLESYFDVCAISVSLYTDISGLAVVLLKSPVVRSSNCESVAASKSESLFVKFPQDTIPIIIERIIIIPHIEPSAILRLFLLSDFFCF